MEKDKKKISEEEYKQKEFERIPDMSTSELMDWDLIPEFKDHDVLYTDIYFDREKGVYPELMRRCPFADLQEQIDDLEKKMKGMQYAIDKLKVHRHHQNTGEVLTTL